MGAEQSSTQPDPNANPCFLAADPREENQLAQSLSASMGANMRHCANGDVDTLHAIGGWRDLVVLPRPLWHSGVVHRDEGVICPDCGVGCGGRCSRWSSQCRALSW